MGQTRSQEPQLYIKMLGVFLILVFIFVNLEMTAKNLAWSAILKSSPEKEKDGGAPPTLRA